VAEKLYTKGFISYPRTETDQFDPGMDLKALIQKQVEDPSWGPYATGYRPLSSTTYLFADTADC